jgi:uncharacterized protein
LAEENVKLHNLVHTVLDQFALAPDGEHGVAHWARVLENGRRLAQQTNANLRVVELFAVLHDSQRQTDSDDPLHGLRAARYCWTLNKTSLQLPEHEFGLLFEACAFHAENRFSNDITVRTCWDADRLDYSRGSTPTDPRYLCTPLAKEPAILSWATNRARLRAIPQLLEEEWRVCWLACPTSTLTFTSQL